MITIKPIFYCTFFVLDYNYQKNLNPFILTVQPMSLWTKYTIKKLKAKNKLEIGYNIFHIWSSTNFYENINALGFWCKLFIIRQRKIIEVVLKVMI